MARHRYRKRPLVFSTLDHHFQCAESLGVLAQNLSTLCGGLFFCHFRSIERQNVPPHTTLNFQYSHQEFLKFQRHIRERFSNFTIAQREGLREIRRRVTDGENCLSVNDKGGEFVVLSWIGRCGAPTDTDTVILLFTAVYNICCFCLIATPRRLW